MTHNNAPKLKEVDAAPVVPTSMDGGSDRDGGTIDEAGGSLSSSVLPRRNEPPSSSAVPDGSGYTAVVAPRAEDGGVIVGEDTPPAGGGGLSATTNTTTKSSTSTMMARTDDTRLENPADVPPDEYAFLVPPHFDNANPFHRDLSTLDLTMRCAICTEFYRAPVTLLPCLHSFCSLCIRNHLRSTYTG